MEPHKGLTILFEYCLLSLVLCNTILVIDQVHIEEWVCMDVQAIKKAENGFWEVCSQEDCTILSPNSHALFSRIVPLCAAGSRGMFTPWFAAHSGFSVTSCLISCFWHLGFVRPVSFTLCLLNHTLFKVGRSLQWSFPAFSVYSWENWSGLSTVSKIRHVADGRAEMRLNLSAPHCHSDFTPPPVSHSSSQQHCLPNHSS